MAGSLVWEWSGLDGVGVVWVHGAWGRGSYKRNCSNLLFHPRLPVLLVGNKADLSPERWVRLCCSGKGKWLVPGINQTVVLPSSDA